MPLDLGSALPDDATVEVKAALRALIDSSGLTQEAIERTTGIDQSRVSRITSPNTTNRPTLADIVSIEEACGVQRGYVLAAAGLATVEGARAGARARVAAARTRTARS